eukprot:GHRQ01017859.1.p1 GENE.GHRQ01017859.1~~GHRQ01017859.1.p1  ORF type:complete len:286 (+),score=117.14 GHRQ01017859.1:118-975(+)
MAALGRWRQPADRSTQQVAANGSKQHSANGSKQQLETAGGQRLVSGCRRLTAHLVAGVLQRVTASTGRCSLDLSTLEQLHHQQSYHHCCCRLSLSWSRILPAGGRGTEPNAAGLRFYRQLLQALQAAGIHPVVTLCHMDLPQVLQDIYGGFLDPQLSEDFVYYADVVFQQLGRYVRHWLTFSDPMATCQLGYGVGAYAPGVEKGAAGHYRCGHTLLLAHAKAVQLYRMKYQQAQEGRISMVISAHWGLPYDASSKADKNATDTYMQFQLGWMADPLFFGDYPEVC